jgi:PH domain associated with Beige/BEACH/Beige/BEACH domain
MVAHKVLDDRKLTKEWSLGQIREIQLRKFIQRQTALEIFFLDGSSIFLNFPQSGRDEVAVKLVRMRKTKCANLNYRSTLDPLKLVEKSEIQKKWRAYEVSNFEYLMHLNSLAGRSYRDVM